MTIQFWVKPTVTLVTYATFMLALQQLSRAHQRHANGKKSVRSNILNDIFTGRRDKVCGSSSCTTQVVAHPGSVSRWADGSASGICKQQIS